MSIFKRKRPPRITLKDWDRAVAAALNYPHENGHWNENNVAVIENDWTYGFVLEVFEAAGIEVDQ